MPCHTLLVQRVHTQSTADTTTPLFLVFESDPGFPAISSSGLRFSLKAASCDSDPDSPRFLISPITFEEAVLMGPLESTGPFLLAFLQYFGLD
jgi:hypothetical protein